MTDEVEMYRKTKTAREVLEEIATFPLTKTAEKDRFGETKHGSSSYGVGYAAWRIQQMAQEWVAANTRAKVRSQ